MDLDMEKISDPKALTFEVWDLETSLWQFGPKALCNGLIKPLLGRSEACRNVLEKSPQGGSEKHYLLQ